MRLTGTVLAVGLTGGIAAGKSVVSARLADLGATVVDSDRLAREVVAPGTEGLREVVEAFGERVLSEDGSLDRARLAEVVFADDRARQRLESIIHPRVRARSAELTARAGAEAIVVHDVPLLMEVGLAPTYHLVIVVEAERDLRVERLVSQRSMTPAQAQARIQAQATDEQRRAVADVVLSNDENLDQLYGAVDALWRDRLVPYERNVRARRPAGRARTDLVEADPDWPARFARLAARIGHALDPVHPPIDHIGPTAVPGLPAIGGVIDAQLGVSSLAEADALADRLAGAGFPRCPEPGPGDPTRPGEAASPSGDLTRPEEEAGRSAGRLHASADPAQPARLHVRPVGSAAWRSALLMRDDLRADPEQRDRYRAFLRDVAAREPGRPVEPWFDETRGA